MKTHEKCSICHTPFEYGDIKVFRGDDERRFCYYCAAKAADLFETTSALIGKVTEVETGWEVAFAPDCTTWVTVRRDEHDEPKVGDSITVTVPKVVAIHSQPPTGQPPPRLGGGSVAPPAVRLRRHERTDRNGNHATCRR